MTEEAGVRFEVSVPRTAVTAGVVPDELVRAGELRRVSVTPAGIMAVSAALRAGVSLHHQRPERQLCLYGCA